MITKKDHMLSTRGGLHAQKKGEGEGGEGQDKSWRGAARGDTTLA